MRDTFECQPYLAHLAVEHRRLRDAEQMAASAIDAWRRDASHRERQAVAIAAVRSLIEVFQHHFVEEESGGCLEQAISLNPHVGRDADKLVAEQASLREAAAGVLAAFEDARPGATTRVATAFDELRRALDAHCAAEGRLIENAFGAGVEDAPSSAPRPR